RKLYSFNMVTVDGYFEGASWEIDWHRVDAEFNDFAVAQLHATGALLFGRVTYQGMASYWPTPAAIESDPEVAGLMNDMPKIVFSKTMEKAEWNNSRFVRDHIAEEVSKLKGQPGGDLGVFGSANLLSTLIQMDLVDEHRVIVNPVVLGHGSPLFKTSKDRLPLRLVKSRTFGNGNVLLCYEPERNGHAGSK
ncbi:MAG: dihydrofolate reductase family protein, partial [Chloroflexi bacterium]|nr:dihydrofolate reductase family protein [Chloroflexota bacterium]